MVDIEAVAGSLVVEGELVFDEADEACGRFERALGDLQRSDARIPAVDLARVSAVSPRAAELLFALWLDLLREGRALLLLAPDYAWEMLGRAAVDRMLVNRATRAARSAQADQSWQAERRLPPLVRLPAREGDRDAAARAARRE